MVQVAEVAVPVLEGTDHVELWVGNARQAAYHYRKAFGFDVIAYAGPETGIRDRASYVLQQGKVRLVLTAPLQPEGDIADHLRLHGDGVRTIALRVADATAAYEAATARGARSVAEPSRAEDEHGVVTSASIATFGDTIHTFVERDEYSGVFWPGYRADNRSGGGVGLRFIDHTVGNVDTGKMDDWISFYSEVFGFTVFQEFDEKDIATQYSALRSKVARDPRTQITMPINEPYVGLKKSQIQEYLDYYRGSGIQHIAVHTDDIVGTVSEMRDRGVEFLTAPGDGARVQGGVLPPATRLRVAVRALARNARAARHGAGRRQPLVVAVGRDARPPRHRVDAQRAVDGLGYQALLER